MYKYTIGYTYRHGTVGDKFNRFTNSRRRIGNWELLRWLILTTAITTTTTMMISVTI